MSTLRFCLEDELSFTTPTSATSRFQASYERVSSQPERTFSVGFGNTPGIASTRCGAPNSPGSRNEFVFQPSSQAPSDSGQAIFKHTSANSSDGCVRKMDYSHVQHSTPWTRSTSDNKTLHGEHLSYGRMERAAVSPAERQRSGGSQYGQLVGYPAGESVLSDPPDTDLCLSMVNETRPSYQMKTFGKTPLTPPHLMSLVDSNSSPATGLYNNNNNREPSSLSPKVSPYSITTSSSQHVSYSGEALSATTISGKPPPSIYSKPISPGSASNRSALNSLNSTPTVDYQRPVRTFSDFDPDDFLKDLRITPSQNAHKQQTTAPPPSAISPSSSRYPYVSPNARGLAPPPTDQPIRNPARVGIEADVDSLTIRMIRNMESGYGAAGEYNCVKCSEGISSSRPGCTALDKTYHLKCFTCSVCNVELAGGPFYSIDGKPYCENDYQDTLDKCASCNKPITDRILKASGKPFHPNCFICTSCSRSLDGVPFTVDANNLVHCVQCFHDKFAPRCAICHKPIVPEEGKQESMRVVAMDKSFHVNCYKCEDCGLLLSSKIEGHECYPLDDHLLCKKCNATRIRKLTTP